MDRQQCIIVSNKNFGFPQKLCAETCRNDLKLTSAWTARTNFLLENQKITEAGAIKSSLTSGSSTSGHLGLVGIESLTYRLYDPLLNGTTFKQQERAMFEFMGNEWCSGQTDLQNLILLRGEICIN